MSDQVEIQLPKTRWNESDVFTATAYFRTRSSKAALAPTTVHYQVDCLTTHTPLQTLTSASAAASVGLTMTAAINAIQSADSSLETKQLIVIADKDLSTRAVGRVQWKVKNIHGVG